MTTKEAIKKQVDILRTWYDIGIYPDEIRKVCNECDQENYKFSIINKLGYEQINLTNLGIQEPFHRASLIGFNKGNNLEWFIVDPTYGQFFENEKFKNYMFNNYQDFSIVLLKQGYIECNLQNILSYINGFILSNAYTSNIDICKIYKNVENLLLSANILNKEISVIEKRIIELLNLRKKLLETIPETYKDYKIR